MKNNKGFVELVDGDRLVRLDLQVSGFTFSGSPKNFQTTTMLVVDKSGAYIVLRQCQTNTVVFKQYLFEETNAVARMEG